MQRLITLVPTTIDQVASQASSISPNRESNIHVTPTGVGALAHVVEVKTTRTHPEAERRLIMHRIQELHGDS